MGRSDPSHFKSTLSELSTFWFLSRSKGLSFEQSAKKIGVTVQTLARWRKEYSGLGLEQAKRLKELEKENSRLKRLVADKELDILILKETCKGKF